MTVSDFGELEMLNKMPSTVYMKLHTGDPGESGLNNAAAEATRKAVTFGAAASGARKNTTSPEWTNVAATETYRYFSLWDAASGGNCWGSGLLLEEKGMAAGESITFPIGEVVFELN